MFLGVVVLYITAVYISSDFYYIVEYIQSTEPMIFSKWVQLKVLTGYISLITVFKIMVLKDKQAVQHFIWGACSVGSIKCNKNNNNNNKPETILSAPATVNTGSCRRYVGKIFTITKITTGTSEIYSLQRLGFLGYQATHLKGSWTSFANTFKKEIRQQCSDG